MLDLNYLVVQLEVIKRKVMKLNLKRNMEMLNLNIKYLKM